MKRFSDQWLPPDDAGTYFRMDSDDEFKAEHPVGYWFVFALGLVALFLPVVLYVIYALSINPKGNYWILLGCAGGFVFGIGLFNFVAIILRQYMGHVVSILSFLIGWIMIVVSLQFL